MEHILGPPVASAGNYAEHILQRERHPGPVMGFELGDRNEEVHAQHGTRKIQLLEARSARRQWNTVHVVKVEIAEETSNRASEFLQFHGLEDGKRVAIHRWPVADQNL